MRTRTHIPTRTRTQTLSPAYTYTHSCIRTHTHPRAHAHKHSHTHVRARAHTHRHPFTHAHTNRESERAWKHKPKFRAGGGCSAACEGIRRLRNGASAIEQRGEQTAPSSDAPFLPSTLTAPGDTRCRPGKAPDALATCRTKRRLDKRYSGHYGSQAPVLATCAPCCSSFPSSVYI